MRETLTLTQIARFWANVKKGSMEECWPWTGTLTNGYGEISLDYVKVKSHRFAYVLFNGPILHGDRILHSCDNPACCNPFHLKNGTAQDNSSDMVEKGRSKKGVKHWAAKLTDDKIRAIRKCRWPQKLIADEYGISQSKVSMIKSRKAWSHVNDEPDPNF